MIQYQKLLGLLQIKGQLTAKSSHSRIVRFDTNLFRLSPIWWVDKTVFYEVGWLRLDISAKKLNNLILKSSIYCPSSKWLGSELMFKTYEKIDIAQELLSNGLELFNKGEYISALHLAGAAEEILGCILKTKGGTPTIVDLTKSGLRFANLVEQSGVQHSEKTIRNEANRPKNSVKHGADDTRLYVERDASQMLTRAIENFDMLRNDFELDLDESEQIREHRSKGEKTTWLGTT